MPSNSQNFIENPTDLCGRNKTFGSRVVSQPVVRGVLEVGHTSQASLGKESDAIQNAFKSLTNGAGSAMLVDLTTAVLWIGRTPWHRKYADCVCLMIERYNYQPQDC